MVLAVKDSRERFKVGGGEGAVGSVVLDIQEWDVARQSHPLYVFIYVEI